MSLVSQMHPKVSPLQFANCFHHNILKPLVITLSVLLLEQTLMNFYLSGYQMYSLASPWKAETVSHSVLI